MKFVPTSFKQPKTVASVTAAFQKAINDLLQIENENNAKHDFIEAERKARDEAHARYLEDTDYKQDAVLAEADRAAKVRVKLEALLS